ncbi:MAG: hypothetical protein ACLPTF_10190 [Steroidobacteraceae bacterium]
MLRSVLALFSDSTTAAPASSPAAREHLREAFVERARAVQALQAAIAHTERVNAIIEAADTAAKELQVAESSAAAAARDWAASGAKGDGSQGPEFGRATQAREKAYRARLQAEGAEAALPPVAEAEQAARHTLDQAEESLRAGASAVVLADIMPELAAIEEAAAPLFARYTRLVALANVLRPDSPKHAWATRHPYRDLSGSVSHEPLTARLGAVPFKEPAPSDSFALASDWATKIKRLAHDAADDI